MCKGHVSSKQLRKSHLLSAMVEGSRAKQRLKLGQESRNVQTLVSNAVQHPRDDSTEGSKKSCGRQ
eukprot:4299175-Karenia_brevis.AAC.1